MMESKFESLWLDTSEKTTYPAVSKKVDVDVIVVGGGIAGLMVAYFLTKEGKKVAVLESFRIATGTTGYTTAKVTSLHGAKYAFLKKNFGLEKAKTYADSNQWAIDELEKIIKTENIDCSFVRTNAYLYTKEEKNIEKIKEEFDVAKEIGLPVSYKENLEKLPFPLRSVLQLSKQAQFHPRNFLIALAERIVQNGGYIFENSQVEKVSDGDPCTVVTNGISLNAKEVIVATNYPITDKAMLYLRMGQMRSYALAFQTTEKIPEEMFIGYGHEEFTIRTYSEKNKTWVVIGGEDHPVGETAETDKKYQLLEEETRKYFSFNTIDYKWSAQDASPLDQVPYIGKMPKTDHVYITTGFSEWGMTTSVMSAKLLTDLIQHRENEWEQFYSPKRVNIKASLGKTLEQGKQVMKGFGAYVTRHDDTDFSSMEKGEGRVVDYNGEKMAVCKDENGKLCALSAICTHLACIVEWNKAEMTWDCPCHGSRFDMKGKVIHGPALTDLEIKEISPH